MYRTVPSSSRVGYSHSTNCFHSCLPECIVANGMDDASYTQRRRHHRSLAYKQIFFFFFSETKFSLCCTYLLTTELFFFVFCWWVVVRRRQAVICFFGWILFFVGYILFIITYFLLNSFGIGGGGDGGRILPNQTLVAQPSIIPWKMIEWYIHKERITSVFHFQRERRSVVGRRRLFFPRSLFCFVLLDG